MEDFAYAPSPVAAVAVLDRSLGVVDASRAVALHVASAAEVYACGMSRTGGAGHGDDLFCQFVAFSTSLFQADTHDARWEVFWLNGVVKSVVLFSWLIFFWLDRSA